MTTTMWIVTLWAVIVPILGLAFGFLDFRRDTFFLFLYAQSLIYIDLAPMAAAADVNAAMQDRYVWVQTWVLLLFQLPFTLLYLLALRRRRRRLPSQREFHVSPLRLLVFGAGCTAFGIAYFVIAAKYGLLYRRLGGELATIQLSMSIVEFGLYRAFTELGPFLIAVQLLLLRTSTDMSPALRRWAWLSLVITTLLFMGYAVINSRLYAIMSVIIPYGLLNVTTPRDRRLSLTMVASTIVLAVAGLYFIRVAQNVRLAIGSGGSVFELENFLPVAAREGQQDDTLRWRLNGVDLIAIIADNVEAQGPALGTAWAVPFVLSLDPIVRTPFTVQAKAANLTAAKTWLLLRYGGLAKADYYNCMLSDAYGNFSIYGFLMPALLLSLVLSAATAALRWSAAPTALVFAAFAITRVITFEQEFASLLFGWYKLMPFLFAILLVYPLRRVRPPAAKASSAIS